MCRRCGGAIAVGDTIASSSRENAHRACARLGIVPTSTAPTSRYLVGARDVIGKPCEGCGFTIDPGEAYVTVSAVPWHRECRTRR